MRTSNFWSTFLLKFRHRLLTRTKGSGRQSIVPGIRRKSGNYFTGFRRQKETLKLRNAVGCHRPMAGERCNASDRTAMKCEFNSTYSRSKTSYTVNKTRSPIANQKSRKLTNDSTVGSSSNETSEYSSSSNNNRRRRRRKRRRRSRTRTRSDVEVDCSSSSSSSSSSSGGGGSSSSGSSRISSNESSSNESSSSSSSSSHSVLSLKSRNHGNSAGFRVVGKQESRKSSEYSARGDAVEGETASHSDSQSRTSRPNSSADSSTKSNFADTKFRPVFIRMESIDNRTVANEEDEEEEEEAFTEELRLADDTSQLKRPRSSMADLDLKNVRLDFATDVNPRSTGKSTRNTVDEEDENSRERSLQTAAAHPVAESCCKINDSRSSRKRELVKIVMKKTGIKGGMTARKLTKSPIINIYGEVVFDRCTLEDKSKPPESADDSLKKLQGPEQGSKAETEGEVELEVGNEKTSDLEAGKEENEKGEEREKDEATRRETEETDGVLENSALVKTRRRKEFEEHREVIENPEEIIRINSENWYQKERLREFREQSERQMRPFENSEDFDAEFDLFKNDLTVLCENAIASTSTSELCSTKQSNSFSGFENSSGSVDDGLKRRKFRRCELRSSRSNDEDDECLLCASFSSGESSEMRTTAQNDVTNAIVPAQHSRNRCSRSLNWNRQEQRHRQSYGRQISKIEDHTSTAADQMADSPTGGAIFHTKETILCGPALALRSSSNLSPKEADLKSEVNISVDVVDDYDDDTKLEYVLHEKSGTVAIKDPTAYVSPSRTLSKTGTSKTRLNFTFPSGRTCDGSPEPVSNKKSGSWSKNTKGNGEKRRPESTPSTKPNSQASPRRDQQYSSRKTRNDNANAQRKSPGSYQHERCEKSRSNSQSKSNLAADDRIRERRKSSSRTDNQRVAEKTEATGSRWEKAPSTAKSSYESNKRGDDGHRRHHEANSARNDTGRRRSEVTRSKRSRSRSARDREEHGYERPQRNEDFEFAGDWQNSSQIQTNVFNTSPYLYFPFASSAHRFAGPSFGYNPYLLEFDYQSFRHRHHPPPITSTFPPGPRIYFQHWPRHQIPYPHNFPFAFPSPAVAADDDAVFEPDDQKTSGECEAFSQDNWQNDFMPTEGNAQTQEQERSTADTIDGEIRGTLPSQTVCHKQL